MISRIKHNKGFTLIELMVVVAIIGILAAVATVSYRHFTEKAKSVEAEVALAEVNRLEQLYHTNHGSYSGDLNAIGFSMVPGLKYFQIGVRVDNGGASFQATAMPLASSKNQVALVLTRTPDGQIGLSKADPKTLVGQMGGLSGSSGNSPADPAGSGGAASGGGGGASKLSCREGGEATVAADGLLDMNFCLK